MKPATVVNVFVNTEDSEMTQQAILEAIQQEREEAEKLVARVTELETNDAQNKTLIAEMKGMLTSQDVDIMNLRSKVGQLEASQVDSSAIIKGIKGIVVAPVSSAVVEEVRNNEEIPTPPEVEATPVIAPEVVPPAPVVDAALAALQDFEVGADEI